MSANLFSETTISQIQDIKKKYKGKRIAFCCSAFDILHCGHILMLQDCKKQGDVLIVGLHTNPNLDRDSKNVPIQEYEERLIQIEGCRYVDEVIKYATEDDLYKILVTLTPNVRILGTDWKGKEYTGHQLDIPIHWHPRTHNWSTTYLRERIYQAEKNKRTTTMITQDTPTHYTIREV